MINTRTVLAALAAFTASTPALADVTISTDTTQNMSCSGGVCEPTASDAVLNVNDLEAYLASGSVEVTTTGSGVEASNIDIEAALTWSDSSALSLVATHAITVDDSVSVAGVGGLAVTTDGQYEDFSFGRSGNISFSNLSSVLTINGGSFTLVGNIQDLASAVQKNPNGNYALAANYNAHGTYHSTPVATEFAGVFDGLGNEIANFNLKDTMNKANLGLFSQLASGGTLRNIRLVNLNILGKSAGKSSVYQYIGSLVAISQGTIFNSHATGYIEEKGGRNSGTLGGLVAQIEGGVISYSGTSVGVSSYGREDGQYAGGLAATNSGTIEDCYATDGAYVPYSTFGVVGGLVGENNGIIEQSFASGGVTAGDISYAGGLVAINSGEIKDGYAAGASASAGNGEVGQYTLIGGLVGWGQSGKIAYSYSTVGVGNQGYAYIGGLIGKNDAHVTDAYWDETTSGTEIGVGDGPHKGVRGVTTKRLKSGLPSGFDPAIWAEDSRINKGLPYLIDNPPPK